MRPEKVRLKAEILLQTVLGRIRRLNGCDDFVAIRKAKPCDHGSPLGKSRLPPLRIAGDEKLLGMEKFGFQFFESVSHFFEFCVGQEMGQATQKWKCIFLNESVNAPLNERQFFKTFPRQKTLVPKRNQTVGNLRRFQSDFFGLQLLVGAPVGKVAGDEDALAGQGFNEFVVLCFHKIGMCY